MFRISRRSPVVLTINCFSLFVLNSACLLPAQWVNIATVVFLLFYPTDERFSALVFAMNEGPLSGALVVWQCAWVFGSREHTFR
jgi:hypothetical protein